MHLLFLSTILSLNNLTPYSTGPLSTVSIPRNNETYIPDGFTRDEALKQIVSKTTSLQHDIIEKAAYNLPTSFLISPILISTAIHWIQHGYDNSGQQMSSYIVSSWLHIPQNAYVAKVGMQALIDDLAAYEPSGLRMARSVFASPRLQLRPEFVEVTTKGFRSSIRTVDFDYATDRESFIRSWCRGRDDHRAIDFADPCTPYAGMSLVILNALHLNVKWLHKFPVEDTEIRSFNNSKGVLKPLVMMKTTGYFRHGSFSEGNTTFVELPFNTTNGAQNMSMFIIRPRNLENPLVFLDSLKYLRIENLIARGEYSTITVEVPRFQIQNEINIMMVLLGRGVTTSSSANAFEKLYNKYKEIDQTVSLCLGRHIDKSAIDVSEEGVQAVTMDHLSIPNIANPAPFQLDYPFYFIIGTTGKYPVNLITGRFNG